MAALPPTEVCMNCHKAILPNSAKLAEVRKSYVEGTPIPWVKVHDLADYVYFNHSAHVSVGVGCIECHGPIQQMETVRIVAAAEHGMVSVVPPQSRAVPAAAGPGDEHGLDAAASRHGAADLGKELREKYHVNPSTDCVTCHR